MTAVVDRLAGVLAKRTNRRGFLARAAVVGSAVAAAPLAYVLKPGTAYAAVCGPGASCGEGWSVFCCTINDGHNRCPPGTLAAGWWKSDASPFCCAGGAPQPRYIIDCNAMCTHCASGCGPFCAPSCVSCSCHCGDTPGSCDQRRVCCNVVRYGQCHQEVSCVGPVVCRMVTCVPPWQLFPSCTSASATDNNTTYHSAPCLAGPCR